MIHHVQEPCDIALTPQRHQRVTRGSRSGVAEVGRRSNKLSPLANSVRHTGVTLVSNTAMYAASTYAARVVALPISRYICLSIIAKDSASPLVYNFWPNGVLNSQPHGGRQADTLKRRVGFAVVRSQVCEGTRQDRHRVRVVTVHPVSPGGGVMEGQTHRNERKNPSASAWTTLC